MSKTYVDILDRPCEQRAKWSKDGLTFILAKDPDGPRYDPKEDEYDYSLWNYAKVTDGNRIIYEFQEEYYGRYKTDPAMFLNRKELEEQVERFDARNWKGAHWVEENSYAYLLSDLGFVYFEHFYKTTLPSGARSNLDPYNKKDLNKIREIYENTVVPQEDFFRKHPGIADMAVYLSFMSCGQQYKYDSADIDYVLFNGNKICDPSLVTTVLDRMNRAFFEAHDVGEFKWTESLPTIREAYLRIQEAIKQPVAPGRKNYVFEYDGIPITFPAAQISDLADLEERSASYGNRRIDMVEEQSVAYEYDDKEYVPEGDGPNMKTPSRHQDREPEM